MIDVTLADVGGLDHIIDVRGWGESLLCGRSGWPLLPLLASFAASPHHN